MVSPKYFHELLTKRKVIARLWDNPERGLILYVYCVHETIEYTASDIRKMSTTEAKLLAYELSLTDLFS